MPNINRAQLEAYLDDALSDRETALVEQALRESEPLRQLLRTAMQERDRGEHSVSAVWRRERVSCPSREQLGSYLLQALDAGQIDYVEFHLQVIGCSFCLANLADLQAKQQDAEPKTHDRRRRIFESSAGLIKVGKKRS